MKKLFVVLFLTMLASWSLAQNLFPEKCIGDWEGNMFIWKQGMIVDSIPVRMQINPLPDSLAWTWRTEYIAPQGPVIKDYSLILQDKSTESYLMDEGDGIVLKAFAFGDRLYSLFEVSGNLLMGIYSIDGNTLQFEISSGRETDKTAMEITNYSIPTLQHSFLTRKE